MHSRKAWLDFVLSRRLDLRPIRVGIMASSTQFPEWVADAIDFVAEVPGVEISLLILEGKRRIPPAPLAPRPQTWWGRIRTAWQDGSLGEKIRGRVDWLNSKSLYLRYRRWQLSSRRIPCEKMVDLSGLLAGVPRIVCNTRAKGRFAEVFDESDVAIVADYKLDWIFKCAFNIIHGPILQAARFGIWSFHHDDHLRYRGGPPAYWEMVHGDPWTGAMLQRINEKLDDGVVLHKEWLRTERDSYSYNLNRAWRASSPWPALASLLLQAHNDLDFSPSSVRSDAPVYKAPKNREIVPFWVRLIGRKVKARLSPLGPRRYHWGIGIIDCSPEDYLSSSTPLEPRWISGPTGCFCADPFVMSYKGLDYLFYEQFHHDGQRGQIAVTSTRDWRQFSQPEIVLGASDTHYSYPLVMEHEGSFYGIPEQCQQNQICLYELCDFPGGWQKVGVLVDNLCALDPTLFFFNGLWWIMAGEGSGVDHLHIFYSSDLRGPWKSHAKNPVVSSRARRARPAGRVFRRGEQLIRPAQYGHRYYGYGLLFYRIDRLTPDDYAETLVRIQLPERSWPFPDGVHHFESAGSRCLVDGQLHFHGPSLPTFGQGVQSL